MIPYLFHFGPFYFNMYGFCIALGLIVFLWQAGKDPLAKKYLKRDQLSQIVIFCVFAGIIGGRLANILQYPADYPTWYDVIAIWDGGLSLGGAVLAVVIALPLYLAWQRIAIVPVFDLAGIYGALLQAISRLGCFFAGCCHGYQTNVAWAIIYTHPDSRALLHVPLHPSQLYSAATLFIIFLFIKFIARSHLAKPGQLTGLCLILTSLERFGNDFFRAEHYTEKHLFYNLISQNQLLALILFGLGILVFVIASMARSQAYKKS